MVNQDHLDKEENVVYRVIWDFGKLMEVKESVNNMEDMVRMEIQVKNMKL